MYIENMNRETQTQKLTKKRTHEKHTHTQCTCIYYILIIVLVLPRHTVRPKTRTRAPIRTMSRAIKSSPSYNESDMRLAICHQFFWHILSVSDNSVQVRVPDTDRTRKSRNQ
jgi:hypothetical protein